MACVILARATSNCTGFSTNGSTAANYEFYRFYNFQSLHASVGNSSIPYPHTNNVKIFSSDPLTSGWNARSWFRPASDTRPVDIQYNQSEVYISNNPDSAQSPPTYLTLRTRRLTTGAQLAAEIQYSEYNVSYASIRLAGRVRGDPGAVAGFFTYHNDTAESDIEILTRDRANQVHFSNQPTSNSHTGSAIRDSSFNMSLSNRFVTSAWNTYRLDWTPKRSAWYVNGIQAAETQVNVPEAASAVLINMWSNGGPFSGEMRVGGEALFDIRWIELLFNTTTNIASSQGTAGSLCSVEASPGSPVTIKSGSSHRSQYRSGRLTTCWLFFLIFSFCMGNIC